MINVRNLKLCRLERVFYQDEARNVQDANGVFSTKYEKLRQLCCHPSIKWANRLHKGKAGSTTISLEVMISRMVDFKKEDVRKLTNQLTLAKGHIKSAKYMSALVFDKYPAMNRENYHPDPRIEETKEFGRESKKHVRVILSNAAEARKVEYVYCTTKKAKNFLAKLQRSQGEAMAFLEENHDFFTRIGPARVQDLERQLAQLNGEMNYFQSNFDGEGIRPDRDCMICLDNPTGVVCVLPCAHWICGLCFDGDNTKNPPQIGWFDACAQAQGSPSCPECRRGVSKTDVHRTDLCKTASGAVCGSCDDGEQKNPIEIEEELSPNVDKYGTKFAAVLDFVLEVLCADETNRIIIFSQWEGAFRLLG